MNDKDQPASSSPPPAPAPAAKLPPTQMTWQHQVMIWALILIVGVLFGMGPSFTLMLHPTATVWRDVSEIEVVKRSSVANKLQAAIGTDYRSEQFVRSNAQLYAQDIWQAKLASDEGLEPKGEVLDKLVKDFKNTKLPNNPNRTYANALAEQQGTDNEVTEPELRRFVAERFALKAFVARKVGAPAVSSSVVDTFWSDFQDKIEVDEVTLSVKPILEKFMPGDDDSEIDSTYQKHQDRFMKPASRQLSVAYLDVAALAETQTVSDEEANKYYVEHQREFIKPPEPKSDEKKAEEQKKEDADKKPEPEKIKDFADVKDEIKAKLKRERADAAAKQQVEAFDAQVVELDLENKSAEEFEQAALAAGLMYKKVTVDEPKGPTLEFKGLGTLKQTEREIQLFAKNEKEISMLRQTTGEAPVYLVFRIDGKTDSGPRLLEEPGVKQEVKNILAGERAYADLLARAAVIQKEAQGKGLGGLDALFKVEEYAAYWDAKPKQEKLSPLTEVRPPPATVDEQPGEAKLLISLASAEAPVTVAAGEPTSDGLPTVKLMQYRSYIPGEPPKQEERKRMLASFRTYAIAEHRRSLFTAELNKEAVNR
jgi:hypothetical protein